MTISNTELAKATLNKIKIQLMLNKKTIFYSLILFSLKITITDTVRIAGVDGEYLLINPVYFNSLSFAEQIGLICHEILHVALNHMLRRGTRNHDDFNIAADHVINLSLLKANFKLPPTNCKDRRFKDMNTEQVYEIIHREKQTHKTERDIIYTKKKDISKIKNKIATTVIQAKIQMKKAGISAGTLPAGVEIILEKSIHPILPWNQILNNYLSDFTADDYTMRKLNRKYFPNFYLPTLYNPSICNLTAAFDLSGSMSKKIATDYLNEIDALHKTMCPKKFTIFCFNTKITSIQEITSDQNLKKDLKLRGGGGTSIFPVLKWANVHRPEILLIFTDGEFELPKKFPPIHIIWIIHGNCPFHPKAGKVIRYLGEN